MTAHLVLTLQRHPAQRPRVKGDKAETCIMTDKIKALLITPGSQLVEPVEVTGLDDIKALIGFDTLESDAVGAAGDRLYFDEECFLRGTAGRFQIDSLIPVSGKGVVVGTVQDGTTLCDVATTIDELRRRIKYQ
jgi:hypothetical protein